MSAIASRLKEERKRLGVNQEDFAHMAGITRRPYVEWESGKTAPNAVQLSLLAQAGVDILYVVTGCRSAELLSSDELDLLRLFRASSLTGKMAAVGALNGAVTAQESAVKQKIIGGVSGQVAGRNVKIKRAGE